MSMQKKNNFEEPVTAQAPTTPEANTTEQTSEAEITKITAEPMAIQDAPNTIGGFMAAYLTNGYYRGEGKDR